MLSQKDIDRLKQVYRKDFEMFGYQKVGPQKVLRISQIGGRICVREDIQMTLNIMFFAFLYILFEGNVIGCQSLFIIPTALIFILLHSQLYNL